MTGLLLHVLAVGAALAAAAAMAERALRMRGRAARDVWTGAIGLSLLLPLLARERDALVIAPSSAAAALLSRETKPMLPTGYGLALWGLMSGGLFAMAGLSARRLGVRRRAWRRIVVLGESVWLSEREGPAVVGAWRPEIVLPRWVLDLPEAELRLLLAHEREHIAARDVQLLALGFGALALLPWNAPLWWCVRRLRFAVEADCDRRVVRRGADVRAYAGVLLRAASVRQSAPALALGAGRSRLGRRLEELVPPHRRFPRIKGAAYTGFAAALLGAAVALPADVRAELDAPWRSSLRAPGSVAAGALPSAVAIDRQTGDTLAIVTPDGCVARDARFCRGSVAAGPLTRGAWREREQAVRALLRSARALGGSIQDTL